MIIQNNKNTLYYLATIGLFILFKLGYTLASNDHLIFLLKPTDKIVGLLTGSTAVYMEDKGYYHSSFNILIEKSCSGFNFMLLCFCMLSFLLLQYSSKPLYKSLTIPFAIATSYILTILVNASRIFASILLQQQASRFLPTLSRSLVHESIGVITNLSFLILIYMATEKFLTNTYSNAKPT